MTRSLPSHYLDSSFVFMFVHVQRYQHNSLLYTCSIWPDKPGTEENCELWVLMCSFYVSALKSHNCNLGVFLFLRGFPRDGECQPCLSECTSCHGNASTCLSCEQSYFLVEHSCLRHCPDGYYTAETECRRCPDDCKECNRDGLCKSEYDQRAVKTDQG